MDEKTVIFKTINLIIQGVGSGDSVNKISNALKSVEGVEMVDVNPDNGETRIMYSPTLATIDDLINGVKSAGYEAKYLKDSLS